MPRSVREALAEGRETRVERHETRVEVRDTFTEHRQTRVGAGSRDDAASGDAAQIPGDPAQPLGDPESVARAICLRMLTQRARSRAELSSALARRGVPSAAADRVLNRFVEVGLIDDAALAHSLAGAQHRERGLARKAVALKLRQRGLDDEAVQAGLAEIDADSERQRAEQLVRRKLPAMAALPAPVRHRRLMAMLARKGYSSDVAYAALRRASAEVDFASGDAEPEWRVDLGS